MFETCGHFVAFLEIIENVLGCTLRTACADFIGLAVGFAYPYSFVSNASLVDFYVIELWQIMYCHSFRAFT